MDASRIARKYIKGSAVGDLIEIVVYEIQRRRLLSLEMHGKYKNFARNSKRTENEGNKSRCEAKNSNETFSRCETSTK